MPKHYCDYCDVFLTHDSASVRKAHNSGRNHLANVRDYYASLGHDKAQSIIDQITAAYETSGGPPPGGFGFGPQHLAPPAPFAPPPMGFGGPGFGGPPGRPPFPPMPGMMMPPGALPFPPNGPAPAGMGAPGMGAPGNFPPSMPPFPPNPAAGNRPPFPPSGNVPQGGNPNALPNGAPPSGFSQAQGPQQNGDHLVPNGPVGGMHPDRMRMMGGR
ncbi:zf-U1-domain-containing protein [Laetiporus sulphureus 93-53]|uniref:U1 small nuclear ribonucleoprotein C n=1 Tax=Laetiporus sulphureus 93-53 TaxID=1314785 RepID=A0A165IHH3_9APHY|nr:zf-U1-domain-containing protein [Laetiporus sulphureus 93-53]KZT13080.1 zf-U1-domain-containing protein [Laetiporus sulphureus 93-53]